jgi:type 1 fimbria pilin
MLKQWMSWSLNPFKQLLHLGAWVCCVNLLCMGVAMGACPNVTITENTTPNAGPTIQLPRTNATETTLYKFTYDIDYSGCGTTSLKLPTTLGSIANGIISFALPGSLASSCGGNNLPFMTNCFNSAAKPVLAISSVNTGIRADITINLTPVATCTSPVFTKDLLGATFSNSCKRFVIAANIKRTTQSLAVLNSNSACTLLSLGDVCLSTGTIDFSAFKFNRSDGTTAFNLGSVGTPTTANVSYSDNPATCSLTLTDVTLNDVTQGDLSTTTQGNPVTGSAAQVLNITLSGCNTDGQAKVKLFTWTFNNPSTDGLALENMAALVSPDTPSQGLSAQIFTDSTLIDPFGASLNSTIVKNNQAYKATTTNSTTVFTHRIRSIRSKDNANSVLGRFKSTATLTVSYL